MNEMIERVARAIDPMCWSMPEDDYPAERRRREARQSQSIITARRVIESMRKPTQAMVEAADDCDDPGSSIFGDPFVPASHEEAWSVMIDEALK